MRQVLSIVSAMMLVCALALAQEQPAPKSEVNISYLTKYLDRMDLKYETREDQHAAHMVMVGDNGKFDLHVLADEDSALAFIVISDYLTVPADHRNCDKVLRRLMKLNWDLNVGKFEWDPDDGEVRFTFAFSTENGVGFEAFAAVFGTLVQTADELINELQKILVAD